MTVPCQLIGAGEHSYNFYSAQASTKLSYKIPAFPETFWKKCRPGDSKTARGPEARGQFLRPRAAFLLEGRDNGWNFNIINRWNWFQSPL